MQNGRLSNDCEVMELFFNSSYSESCNEISQLLLVSFFIKLVHNFDYSTVGITNNDKK